MAERPIRYEVELCLGTWTVVAVQWRFDVRGEEDEYRDPVSWHESEAEARAALAAIQGAEHG